MTDRDQPSMSAFPTFRAMPLWVARAVLWLWRKTWRYAAAVLGLLIIAHLVLNVVAGRRLGAELARVRAQGAPLTLAQAAPPKVPDSQNAAVLYEKAFLGLQDRHDSDAIELFLPVERNPKPHEPRPALAQVEAILGRHEADFRLLEQASLRPACRFPVNWENPNPMEIPFPHLSGVRLAACFLTAKALVDAHHGRAADALNDLAIAVRISNHISAEPTLIAHLVRVACISIVSGALPGVLTAAPPTAGESRRFYDLLGKVDMMGPWVRAMEGERCFGLTTFDQVRRARSGDFLWGLLGMSGPGTSVFDQLRVGTSDLILRRTWRLARMVWGPLLKLDETCYLRLMHAQIELMAKPYRESVKSLEALEEERGDIPWYALISRVTSGVFVRATVRRDEGIARIGLMQAALALRAYQIEHGSYPASLADLRAAGGWAIPDDPFTGKPFIYRREGAGYLIYSVGEDMKDDSGTDAASARARRPPMPRRPTPLRATWWDIPLRMTR